VTAPDVALLAVALVVLGAAVRRPELSGLALALCTLAAIAIVLPVAGPRLAVALWAAWPGVAAALLVGSAGEERARRNARGWPSASSPTWGGILVPGPLFVAALPRGKRRFGCTLGAVFVATLYAAALALYGGRIGWLYPWALRLPRLMLGALALTVALRDGPRSSAVRVGLVLAAGQAAGVLAGAWEPWASMRLVSVAAWVWVGAIVVRAGWGRIE
jgi:hypothetical protein